MKIRLEFVSNSSSSSFCIYGWSENQLKSLNLLDKIKEIEKLENVVFEDIYCEFETWIGFGNSEGDLHPDEDCDHDDILVDGPTDIEIQKLDAIVKKYNLPIPGTNSGTWYNG